MLMEILPKKNRYAKFLEDLEMCNFTASEYSQLYISGWQKDYRLGMDW